MPCGAGMKPPHLGSLCRVNTNVPGNPFPFTSMRFLVFYPERTAETPQINFGGPPASVALLIAIDYAARSPVSIAFIGSRSILGSSDKVCPLPP